MLDNYYKDNYHEKTYYISLIGYWRTDTRCWHHYTITVQGIRNDDQITFSCYFTCFFTFSVVPNPLKCSGTFLIY